jgi:hemerythrin-like domain-containing protein
MPIAIGQAPESDFDDPLGMLSDCHRRIMRFLETLINIAEQTRGGALDEQQHQALQTSLRYFREGAPKHTSDEEDSLFPRIRMRAAASGKRSALLTGLHSDHVAVVTQHETVDELGRRWLSKGLLTVDETQRLVDLLNSLRETYQQHIEIEETQLFPFAAEMLTSDDLQEMGKEMARRRGVHSHE